MIAGVYSTDASAFDASYAARVHIFRCILWWEEYTYFCHDDAIYIARLDFFKKPRGIRGREDLLHAYAHAAAIDYRCISAIPRISIRYC